MAGYRYGSELADYYADADVFVFPSRTDTFGLVMLEAMACGTPVAAYPVTGPIDVVVDGVNGALDVDLGSAIRSALMIDRKRCRKFALSHGWDVIAQRMAAYLEVIDWARPHVVGDCAITYLEAPPAISTRDRAREPKSTHDRHAVGQRHRSGKRRHATVTAAP